MTQKNDQGSLSVRPKTEWEIIIVVAGDVLVSIKSHQWRLKTRSANLDPGPDTLSMD